MAGRARAVVRFNTGSFVAIQHRSATINEWNWARPYNGGGPI